MPLSCVVSIDHEDCVVPDMITVKERRLNDLGAKVGVSRR